MVVGIGTDIVQIDRIRQAYTRHGQNFSRRILTPNELAIFATKKIPRHTWQSALPPKRQQPKLWVQVLAQYRGRI